MGWMEPNAETRKFTRRCMNSPTVSFRFSTLRWVLDMIICICLHEKQGIKLLLYAINAIKA